MKLFLIVDRIKGLHMVDFISRLGGERFTLCGKVFGKNHAVNLFSIDNKLPNICKTCYSNFEIIYKFNFRNFKSHDFDSTFFDKCLENKRKYGWLSQPLAKSKILGASSFGKRNTTKKTW